MANKLTKFIRWQSEGKKNKRKQQMEQTDAALIPRLVFAKKQNSIEQPRRFRGLKESKNSVPRLGFSIFF